MARLPLCALPADLRTVAWCLTSSKVHAAILRWTGLGPGAGPHLWASALKDQAIQTIKARTPYRSIGASSNGNGGDQP